MGFETKYGLSIEPTGLAGPAATAYESEVRRHLTWIDCTRVGRLLLMAIGWHARNNPGNLFMGKIAIRPYTGTDCNASENNGVLTRTGFSQPVIGYSPGIYHHGGACGVSMVKKNDNRGLYPNELLFHELVHALRGASAQFVKPALSGGLKNYDDREEFLAVLVTNIYISDRSNTSKSGLRQNHHGFHPLEPGLATSLNFFKSGRNTYAIISQFCNEHPNFAKWIADVKAPFNPIRAIYKEREKALANSNAATAYLRDGDVQGAMDKIIEDLLAP